MSSSAIGSSMPTLSFEAFWTWLQQHPNCVLRVATPDAVLEHAADGVAIACRE